MPRWAAILAGLVSLALATFVTGYSMGGDGARALGRSPTILLADAAIAALGPLSAPLLGDAGGREHKEPTAEMGSDPAGDAPNPAATSLALPALTVSAALPDGAPQRVHLGVVLVSYAGADGAPTGARSKASAETLATTLAEEAKGDFHKAVAKGDSGSADDIGRLARGLLAPAVEAQVFALQTGDVSPPIDTPRGFWIVKRIE